MRSLARARRSGRELRDRLDPHRTLGPEDLYDRLNDYLWNRYEVEPKPVDPKKLDGGRGEVKPPNIFYDRALDEDPAARLRVVAHEAAHLERHDRIGRLEAEPDPTKSGTYLNNERAPAVARYSPRSREEAEADAFALEFVCPSDEALRRWQADEAATSASVARALGVKPDVARAQLVEALYGIVMGNPLDAEPPVSTFAPDDHQEPAVQHDPDGRRPALVDAGPGCGKTATLVERVAWLIERDVQEESVDPKAAAGRVLALTFSNEAAIELEARVEGRLDREVAERVTAATFHSFCRLLLCKHGHHLDPPVHELAPVIDEAAQEDLILSAMADAGCVEILDLKDLSATASEARRHIDYLKQRLDGDGPDAEPWTPGRLQEFLRSLEPASDPESQQRLEVALAFCRLFEAYEAAKAKAGVLDFSDLVALTFQLLRERPEVAEAYQARFRHVLVDEFQDVSRTVNALLTHLCGSDNPPWVVGDPNQAIYRFLNAAPENVAEFEASFPDSEVYRLRNNYRSAPEIVTVANQLVALLVDPEGEEVTVEERFVASGGVDALPGGPAVRVAVAESDRAEQEGVAEQVKAWVDAGVSPHDIAVLCRRNVDVRDVVLALGRYGVEASATGILTPEGSAGDLAAVVTLHDGGRKARRASLARLAYALGRGRYDEEEIDGVIADLLDLIGSQYGIELERAKDPHPLLLEVASADAALANEAFLGDAFDMMAAFLFDATRYLRRILDSGDIDHDRAQLADVVATLRLTETMTALARAAAFRFSTRSAQEDEEEIPTARRQDRLEFGALLRRKLTDATPTAVTPHKREGAVQVMTCHAAKGLEFPCVCVVGQTLSGYDGSYAWLPPGLQPADEQDREQADALFFVGATRAQRALVVSCAKAATAGGRMRTPTPLLSRWMETFDPPADQWVERAAEGEEVSHETIEFGPIWGHRRKSPLPAYVLHSQACPAETYVARVAGLIFPDAEPALYPVFFDAVREALRFTVVEAHRLGRPLSPQEALRILSRTWKTVEVRREEHRHLALFEQVARGYLMAFAREYAPAAQDFTAIDLGVIEEAAGPAFLDLKLVAAIELVDGRQVAIMLRTESYAAKLNAAGEILWSKMTASRRLPFVLLWEHFPGLEALVFSGADGRLYRFKQSQRASSLGNEVAKITDRRAALAAMRYEAVTNPWRCDRCGSRIVCPHWLRCVE